MYVTVTLVVLCVSHFIFHSPYYLLYSFISIRLFTFKILALGNKYISSYCCLENCPNLRASKNSSFLLTLGDWAVPLLALPGLLLWLHSAGKSARCWDGWDGQDDQSIWRFPPLIFHPGFLQGMAVSGQHFKRMKVEAARPVRSSHRSCVFTSLLPLCW